METPSYERCSLADDCGTLAVESRACAGHPPWVPSDVSETREPMGTLSLTSPSTLEHLRPFRRSFGVSGTVLQLSQPAPQRSRRSESEPVCQLLPQERTAILAKPGKSLSDVTEAKLVKCQLEQALQISGDRVAVDTEFLGNGCKSATGLLRQQPGHLATDCDAIIAHGDAGVCAPAEAISEPSGEVPVIAVTQA